VIAEELSSALFFEGDLMNKKLIILFSFLCLISQSNIIADTVQEEERARLGGGNEAYLTSRQEEIERVSGEDDAYRTEYQEELEHRGLMNDAYETSSAERAARN